MSNRRYWFPFALCLAVARDATLWHSGRRQCVEAEILKAHCMRRNIKDWTIT